MEAALLDDALSGHFPFKPQPPPRVGLGTHQTLLSWDPELISQREPFISASMTQLPPRAHRKYVSFSLQFCKAENRGSADLVNCSNVSRHQVMGSGFNPALACCFWKDLTSSGKGMANGLHSQRPLPPPSFLRQILFIWHRGPS